MDVFSKAKRSEVMSHIRSKANKGTEIALARLLRRNFVNGWRRHLPLPGRPDFTFQKSKLIVFVDGCFWHGCPKCYRPPKTAQGYWSQKIQRNRSRDTRVKHELRKGGWRVLRIWECDLEKHPEKCVRQIMNLLRPKSTLQHQSRTP